MVYYQKDSRPPRAFTSDQLISATFVQTLSTQFWSRPSFGPPLNFADLRSHLLIIHTLLFRRQYKTTTTSLLSSKLYSDLTRVCKSRICPSFKRRSVDFPKVNRNGSNGKIRRVKLTILFKKGLLEKNKNVINATVINRATKISDQWHCTYWFRDSYFHLDYQGHADLWVWGIQKVRSRLFVPLTSRGLRVPLTSILFPLIFFLLRRKRTVLVVYF